MERNSFAPASALDERGSVRTAAVGAAASLALLLNLVLQHLHIIVDSSVTLESESPLAQEEGRPPIQNPPRRNPPARLKLPGIRPVCPSQIGTPTYPIFSQPVENKYVTIFSIC
jgi:hypothetical protein